jgi:uncharacterized protein YndB with AHSA1/START domain
MIPNNQREFIKDLPNKKIIVTRHFSAPVEDVWRAWTESELLDQWWAPKPWRAETKTMTFKVGGYWLYAMVGPDNEKNWCKVEYKAINKNKSFQYSDMFCDENGNKISDFPSMSWNNNFYATHTGSTVIIEITFATVAELEKVIEMGIEPGFTAALVNLDELFQTKASVQ